MAYGPKPRVPATLPPPPRKGPRERAYLHLAEAERDLATAHERRARAYELLAAAEADPLDGPPVDLVRAHVAAKAMGCDPAWLCEQVASGKVAGRKIGTAVFVVRSALNGHTGDDMA